MDEGVVCVAEGADDFGVGAGFGATTFDVGTVVAWGADVAIARVVAVGVGADVGTGAGAGATDASSDALAYRSSAALFSWRLCSGV